MLTIQQVAERLNIGVGTVRGLVKRGELRHSRFGVGRGSIRVSEQALAEYVASTEGAATPPRRRWTPRHLRL